MKFRNTLLPATTGLYLILSAACFTPANASQMDVSGTIAADTVWTADTVMVSGDITVEDNVILTIEPGTLVQVNGKYRFDIQGTLHAVGQPGDTIRFTCHPDSTSSGWNGLYIKDLTGSMMDNDSTMIRWCKFQYGIQRDANSGGCITVYGYSRVQVRNSVFLNNSGVHSAIYCRSNSNFLIANNFFTHNTTNAIYCFNADPVIERNRFVDDAGMLQLSSGSSTVIRNNFFGKNNYTIRCYSSAPLISGNIICNNYQAVELYDSPATLVNNTFCNNDYGVKCSGEIHPAFYNSVIFGNTNYQVYLQDAGSQPDIYYCNIEGDNAFAGGHTHTGDYENNMNAMPDFTEASTGAGTANYDPDADWSLKLTSFMLNAGTPDAGGLKLGERDIIGNPRICYTRIDIGAVEYHKESITECGLSMGNAIWYADTVKITCDFTIQDYDKVTILPATVVEFQGYYKIRVVGTIYALGTEQDPVVFTVKDTTGFSDTDTTLGGWGSLIFNNGDPAHGGADGAMSDNDSSVLRFCRFEYSKKSGTDDWELVFGGAIFLSSFSNIEIEDCSFLSNHAEYGGAIAARNSMPRVRRCCFRNNSSNHGGAVYIDNAGWFEIEDCRFHGNLSIDDGGALQIWQSDGLIKGNVFSNNQADFGGGINFYIAEGGNVLNNLFCNNQATYGGGIYMDESPGITLTGNTIANNRANSGGGGIYLNRTAPEVYNSILWGNDPDQVYLFNLKSQPSVYHSDIQDGTEGFTGSPYIGIAEQILDGDPFFADPPEGTGTAFDGMAADWSLLPVSPCINAGLMNVPDIVLPEVDLAGNDRVFDGTIDIGAYENHSSAPVITEQPRNYIRCVGDSIAFSINTAEKSFLQWQKDGSDIEGATGDVYVIDSLAAVHEGNYQCVVSNAYDTILSNNVFLQVKVPPEILSQSGDIWVQGTKPVSMGVYANGTNLAYQWTRNDTLIPGAVTPEYHIPGADYPDEGKYACVLSNSCGTDTSSRISLCLAPQICMVTVDRETGNNLVVWEKKSRAPILAYNVYRESEAAGIYDLLETVPYDKLSVYEDSVADPTVQAYLYKITALDTAENETDIDLCKPHKTIHLLVTTNPELNTTQLAWDKYYGFEYQTYTIYRSQTKSDFDSIHSLSASLNSWTDPDPLDSDLFYRISVRKPVPCEPEGLGKKAGTGPYSHSLSNMDDNKLKLGSLPPDTITLSNHSVDEEQSPGTVIGKFITEDPDTADAHYYQFIAGTGGEDNLNFTLVGDLLLASESFDYETKNQYSIRVRSTDLAGNYCEVPFTIQVIDIDETTGIPVNRAGTLEVYPNPFSHSATVRFPNPGGESCRMVLRDLSGKVCRIMEGITGTEFILEKGGLKSGLYFIELNGPKTFRGKIVIE